MRWPDETVLATGTTGMTTSATRQAAPGFLAIDQVTKQYGEHTVIGGVSLAAAEGEFVVFVGPSGCGKSTLLRLIAGLDEVSGGTVAIDGEDVTDVAPADRNVSMVFQSYALYPHMTVRDNMAFGLKMIRTPRAEIEQRVAEAAAILRLDQLLDRKPRQLSGGQRQRVAIGRAIVRKPKLFLFDEPLSNLDAELRSEMRFEIAKLHRELGVTMVYVTHDQVEAMTLADRIVVLRAGRVEQIGSPADLYDRPANTFVAGFIGAPKMNFLDARVVGRDEASLLLTQAGVKGGQIRLPLAGRASPADGEEVLIGIRPEHLAPGQHAGAMVLPARVAYVENLGATSLIHGRAAGDKPLVALTSGRYAADEGQVVELGASNDSIYLFRRDGTAF